MDEALRYSVSLYSTPMPWPITFAKHFWFVIEYDGVIERVEVWAPLWVTGETTVVVDALSPYAGFRSSYFYSILHPKRVGLVARQASYIGESGSTAAKLYAVIQSAAENYPYKTQYRLWPGPNSNTFIAWVFTQVPEIKFHFPWGAFGKSFKLPDAT